MISPKLPFEEFVEIGCVLERDYTGELIILEVATASTLYPSLYGGAYSSIFQHSRRPLNFSKSMNPNAPINP